MQLTLFYLYILNIEMTQAQVNIEYSNNNETLPSAKQNS